MLRAAVFAASFLRFSASPAVISLASNRSLILEIFDFKTRKWFNLEGLEKREDGEYYYKSDV